MLLRNTLYNFLGLGLPLLVAIFTIPVLIASLGLDRFGILTLIWALISYFGLFDLGLGRALTQQLAKAWAQNEQEKVNRLIPTGLGVMAGLGMVAGVVLILGAEWFVYQFNSVAHPREMVNAVYAISAAMPFVILTAGLRGILEARHAFGAVNAIRLPMGIYTFLAPVGVVYYWGNDLGLIAVSLTVGRIFAFLAYFWFCRRMFPGIKSWFGMDRSLLKGLLHTGGWMTVSNVISPLMGYLDRFVIGLTVSLSAVSYYVTPYEIIIRLWIIPGALTTVLFPRFSQAGALDQASTGTLFRRGVLAIFLVIYPITLTIALFSRELLTLWLDTGFAQHSYRLLQVFAFGILVNCLAHIPFTYLQGVGRSGTTARIHVLEFPVYALILWQATQAMGLIGAVLAWLLRILVDSLLMFLFALAAMGSRIRQAIIWKHILVMAFVVVSFTGSLLQLESDRLLVLVASVITTYMLCWSLIVSQEDRAGLLKRVRCATD